MNAPAPRWIPGKIGWLELNTQRAAEAQRFYVDLFCWRVGPAHIDPSGLMPLLANHDRTFASVFMAMGAFAPSQWIPHLSVALAGAETRLSRLGFERRSGTATVDGWGRVLHATDPQGQPITLFEREIGDAPDPSRPGDPHTAELWARDGAAAAPAYAELLGLDCEPVPRGWILRGADGAPRLHVRTSPFAPPPNRWIPYFRSRSVGADLRRAQLFGALPQLPREDVAGMGRLVVLTDPVGAPFGLVDPDFGGD